MTAKDLETRLQKRLHKANRSLRAKQKARYELAKALGFSATEAIVLQNWREEDIKDLARQRGYIPSSSPEE